MGADSDIGSTGDRRRARAAAAVARLEVDVVADGADWTILGDLDPQAVVAEVAAIVPAHVELPAPLCVAAAALSHDDDVQALNKAWRGQDKPTNVLSFPSPGGAPAVGPDAATGQFLGDVILAEATLAREAEAMGIPAADHFRHLVLHGLLHLLGHDHETEAEATVMEALETRMLAALGVADPYADPPAGTVPIDVVDAAGDSPPSGARRA